MSLIGRIRRKHKNREDIVKEEILRFKKRVEKRFGHDGKSFGPFVKPEISWHRADQDGVEWNDVHVMMFFSSDTSDMGVTIQA